MPGRKRKRKATSGEYDGMSRNKKGQKSFINQWVTSSLPPNLDWLYFKTKLKIFKASCNFLRAPAAHSDFFFHTLERSNNFPQTPQALTPAKLQKKNPQQFNPYVFPILVLYSLDFLLLRKY